MLFVDASVVHAGFSVEMYVTLPTDSPRSSDDLPQRNATPSISPQRPQPHHLFRLFLFADLFAFCSCCLILFFLLLFALLSTCSLQRPWLTERKKNLKKKKNQAVYLLCKDETNNTLIPVSDSFTFSPPPPLFFPLPPPSPHPESLTTLQARTHISDIMLQ